MHSAPAVTYPVGRSNFQALLTTVLLVLGLSAIGYWYALASELGWRMALAALVWLICAGAVWRGRRVPGVGALCWDGRAWRWESQTGALAGTVVPRLDLQTIVLLEFRAGGRRALWLWMERRQDPGHWAALRRALWARGVAGASRPAIHLP